MLLERRCLWLARTNAWIVAPGGPGGDCVLVDVPPEPDEATGSGPAGRRVEP